MTRGVQSANEVLVGSLVAVAALVGASAAHARVDVLHTYAHSLAHEVDTAIAVDAAKVAARLPAGYVLVPASALGVGGPDQGIVVIVNFDSAA